MQETDHNDAVKDETSTGLPWPKTWNGAYLVVVCSFTLWLGLLLALTEVGK